MRSGGGLSRTVRPEKSRNTSPDMTLKEDVIYRSMRPVYLGEVLSFNNYLIFHVLHSLRLPNHRNSPVRPIDHEHDDADADSRPMPFPP